MRSPRSNVKFDPSGEDLEDLGSSYFLIITVRATWICIAPQYELWKSREECREEVFYWLTIQVGAIFGEYLQTQETHAEKYS